MDLSNRGFIMKYQFVCTIAPINNCDIQFLLTVLLLFYGVATFLIAFVSLLVQ